MQPDVCQHLTMLLNLELGCGNTVACVEALPDLGINRFVLMSQQLHIWGTPATGKLPICVRYWDRSTSFGTFEAGFRCSDHCHVIAGPTFD
jgi:hypothetical protein